ncbi:MAG: cyclopropane fatty acyl phospholipid synthase [Desulfobacteraceae bacterium]
MKPDSYKKAEQYFHRLLYPVDIKINGIRPFDIKVYNRRLYDRILRQGALGFGEAYMDGWWDCRAMDQFMTRILKARLDLKIARNNLLSLCRLTPKVFNLQSRRRAFMVGSEHYDAGNDLYRRMLDKRMNYSCAYFSGTDSLDRAQERKLDLVCRKIGLKPGMHVLDIGCGFGSFARFAAEKYNANVTGITVSKNQAQFGQKMCRGLPVKLLVQDYREMKGQFDAVVSIGMFEHVGYKNYRTYMETVDRCLKPDGTAFIHTIGCNTSSIRVNSWTNKYIFPNGMLPSIAQIGEAMEGIFIMEDWENFGPCYDKTLIEWHKNCENAWPELDRKKYNRRFRRMWRYYLLSCAALFRSRQAQLWQIVMKKPGAEPPGQLRISPGEMGDFT